MADTAIRKYSDLSAAYGTRVSRNVVRWGWNSISASLLGYMSASVGSSKVVCYRMTIVSPRRLGDLIFAKIAYFRVVIET